MGNKKRKSGYISKSRAREGNVSLSYVDILADILKVSGVV